MNTQAGSTPEAKVAVLGAGSWGTILTWLLGGKGVPVRLWARDENAVAQMRATQQNEKYLPNTVLQNVEFTASLSEAVERVQFIVSAIPGAAAPQLAETFKTLPLQTNVILISGTKGLHPESGLRASEIWQRAGWPMDNYVALSGPNLAKEIAAGVPTSTVVASQNCDSAKAAQQLFASPLFRVYTSTDLIGVELGGALKNVIAIAAGVGDGLGFGDNAKASLLTRGWREMTRLATALGAHESTLYGLSGMGDLFATCTSCHSRNHALGVRLSVGESLQEARAGIARTAEGIHTTRAALHLALEREVELPVTEQVAAVLFDGKNPRRAVEDLMKRQERDEVE
jgi:glycerol-3-phosphate dehydrogenase (NAD(P)+)